MLRQYALTCLLGVGALLMLFSACGHKTDIRPPSLVAPEAISDLALTIGERGVMLRWGRPQRYADGSQMDDLGGFVVLRAQRDGAGRQPFARLALIPVEDRDRFQQERKFSYTDEPLTAGTLYRYRVLAVTLDGYLGNVSNTVELVWQEQAGGDKG